MKKKTKNNISNIFTNNDLKKPKHQQTLTTLTKKNTTNKFNIDQVEKAKVTFIQIASSNETQSNAALPITRKTPIMFSGFKAASLASSDLLTSGHSTSG